MAKSLRSKREKRLRTLRREIVEPFYDKKDAAKIAVLEAALAAPKLPVRTKKNSKDDNEDMATDDTAHGSAGMDAEMADRGSSFNHDLKPSGGIGKKKWQKNMKLGKRRRSKGKIQKKKKFNF